MLQKKAQKKSCDFIFKDDNALKSPLNIIGKVPITSATTIMSGQAMHPQQQQPVVIGQPMVVGGSLNLANLLSSRPIIGGDSINAATSIPASNNKVTVNVQTGSSNTKLALPILAAQLNRPVPSYSQSLKALGSTALIDSTLKVQTKDISSTLSSNSNLQALLAGTPSADNPNPHSKGATLLERLSAQSIGLNSMKNNKQNTVGDTKIITSSSPCSILRTDSASSTATSINFANVTNLQGINVSIPNLTGNLQTLQNVQIVAKPPGTSVATTGATVMITNQAGLQQGQMVKFGQFSGSQLANQLTKPSNHAVSTGSAIPVLQVQGVGSSMFTSIQKASTSQPSTSAQPVQVSIAPSSVSYYKNLKFLDS